MTVPASRIDVQPWMALAGTRAVLAALRAAGGDVRFVGGCVRNAALGLAVEDIDLATTLLPQDVMAALRTARLAAVPTGLAHGTVTAVAHGTTFEITTLRRDVETDGRHAIVAFTDDWSADARRRDFTMNALYCDEAGVVLDPVGGLADLQARRVRFVGDPAERLREDYLRALRFFRFSAWYGRLPYDADGLAACAGVSAELVRLSAERVSKEILKLLAATDPVPAWRAMLAARQLVHWLPEAADVEVLARLVTAETALGNVDALRRLAAAIPAGSDALALAARLRLSTVQRDRLVLMLAAPSDTASLFSAKAVRALVHELGNEGARDRLLLTMARSGTDSAAWREALDIAVAWPRPVFPLRGNDVLELGIPSGSAVGEFLQHVEAWWVAGDFVADRTACLAQLAAAVRDRSPT